jgi:hypothetical protein
LCRRDIVTRRKKRHPRHDDAHQFDQLAKILRRRISSAHANRLSHALDNVSPTENLIPLLACAIPLPSALGMYQAELNGKLPSAVDKNII